MSELDKISNETTIYFTYVLIVPFIDTQPVEARVLKPLIGAGIYYKNAPGYGGFIGPLILLHED